MVIKARPETNVLAKVYQLYMVEYQCAFKLINHSHGMDDNTVNANRTINIVQMFAYGHKTPLIIILWSKYRGCNFSHICHLYP